MVFSKSGTILKFDEEYKRYTNGLYLIEIHIN